jgi:hypothetical protein
MWRRGVRVSWLSLKTKVNCLSVVWPQNNWDGFSRFGLKTSDDGFSQFGLKTDGLGFSVLASKPVVTVFSGLASKPVATVSPGLASKPVGWVFWFGPQNRELQFGDLGLKITMIVSWFGP